MGESGVGRNPGATSGPCGAFRNPVRQAEAGKEGGGSLRRGSADPVAAELLPEGRAVHPEDLGGGLCRRPRRDTIRRMELPNADRAEVDLRKLREYCLSPTHPVGKHKAVVFRAALGMTTDDAEVFREKILRAAIEEEAVFERADEFGDRYRLDFEVMATSGGVLVRSAWIIRSGEDFPRLTTCFVLPR